MPPRTLPRGPPRTPPRSAPCPSAPCPSVGLNRLNPGRIRAGCRIRAEIRVNPGPGQSGLNPGPLGTGDHVGGVVGVVHVVLPAHSQDLLGALHPRVRVDENSTAVFQVKKAMVVKNFCSQSISQGVIERSSAEKKEGGPVRGMDKGKSTLSLLRQRRYSGRGIHSMKGRKAEKM